MRLLKWLDLETKPGLLGHWWTLCSPMVIFSWSSRGERVPHLPKCFQSNMVNMGHFLHHLDPEIRKERRFECLNWKIIRKNTLWFITKPVRTIYIYMCVCVCVNFIYADYYYLFYWRIYFTQERSKPVVISLSFI